MAKDTSSDLATQADTTVNLTCGSFTSSHPPQQFKRILVTGLGRSGTSAIASLLHHCEYWLGEQDDMDRQVFENAHLRKLLHKKKYGKIQNLLEKWGNSHQKIAWKEPKLFLSKHLKFFNSFPEDWLIVAIFRDPLASSQRRIFVENESLIDALTHVTLNQKLLCNFILQCKNPLLLISYEKLIHSPETTIKEIRNFLEPCSQHFLSDSAIWDLMKNDKSAYQEDARRQKKKFRESL